MADIQILGVIEGIRYTDTCVIVTASERKSGYKKQDGTIVKEELLSFRVIFKPYFKKYIAEHFSANMLVKIKGTMLPYAKDHEGNTIDGFTLLGQTIDIAAYQTANLRRERRMIKESQEHMEGMPDLDNYNQPDF